jgi:hypothetical protein
MVMDGEVSRMISTLVLRPPAPRDFDAFVGPLLARACAEAGADMGGLRILDSLPRAGAVVLDAPVSVLARLAAMPEVATVSGERGPSAFIRPVRVVAEGG